MNTKRVVAGCGGPSGIVVVYAGSGSGPPNSAGKAKARPYSDWICRENRS